MVNSVERLHTVPGGGQLILRCKDFRTFQILVPLERDCVDVHASLVRLSRPGACGIVRPVVIILGFFSLSGTDGIFFMGAAAIYIFPLPFSEKYSELYCLSFNPSMNKEEREESWRFLDLMADYKRMGVPNNLWVTTASNSEYRVS